VVEHPDPRTDAWWPVFAIVSVATLGVLLAIDRYVELLAAGVAYSATWCIARAEGRSRREGKSR